jgi:ankyrin repeat protein
MIQPNEMKLNLPMEVANGVMATTATVWKMLVAAHNGDLEAIKEMVDACPELIYAQYNYTPPIHFAVREGHLNLVKYLLALGAYDTSYKTYPFSDSLVTIAQDREYTEIERLLQQYADTTTPKFKGDNGQIFYNRTELQIEFEKVVYEEKLERAAQILKEHPEFAMDETFFWGEGILLFAVKENNHAMIDLLTSYGAKVPGILKWTQFYYFERLDAATYIMVKGMNPNVMSWHHVSILHDMAQKGDLQKAELLIKYGADINAVEEEYQSTPLGMATRWGHTEMVSYLLSQGADIHKAGAGWATPLAWAEKKKRLEIAKMLVGAGAK